jgi:peptidoglycan hydrolase-like protein with peptidoglycan-binding domain
MKKLFVLAAITACALPSLALAAYNDVTLMTDAVIQVGSYTLDVSGSSATIQSITVNSSNFSVTLASGSAVTVTSPTLQQLTSDVSSDVVSNPCTGSESSISLAYSGAGTVTNVITPSATVCSGSGSTPPPAPAPSGGGWSGGCSTYPQGEVPSWGVVPCTPTNPSQGHAVLPGTQSSPTPTSSPPSVQSQGSTLQNGGGITLTKNHQIWDRGADIRALQKFFNAHGFIIATTGSGSPGSETSIFGTHTYQALIKFQQSKDLPQTGYLGPMTRAALGSTAATATSTNATTSAETSTSQ